MWDLLASQTQGNQPFSIPLRMQRRQLAHIHSPRSSHILANSTATFSQTSQDSLKVLRKARGSGINSFAMPQEQKCFYTSSHLRKRILSRHMRLYVTRLKSTMNRYLKK